MNVTVNSTVSYTINTVNIAPIQVIKDNTGALIFIVSFQWLDSANKVIRHAGNRYTQAQLIAASPDPIQTTTYINAINTLFADGISPMLRITMNNVGDIATVQAFCSNMIGEPPVKTFQAKTYTEAELVAAGLSSPIIAGMINQIAISLT